MELSARDRMEDTGRTHPKMLIVPGYESHHPRDSGRLDRRACVADIRTISFCNDGP